MPALAVVLLVLGALALRLFSTALVVAVALVVVALLARSIPGLRHLLKLARYRVEVADFRWRDDIDPIEFERRCAEALRLAGWSARTTKGSGDQGVDVLAERGGIRLEQIQLNPDHGRRERSASPDSGLAENALAIQCKRYGKAVGNRAVQEALSGKAFYDAQHGIVVSNAEFTAAAQQLAAKTGIVLMHVTDLRHINRRYGFADASAPIADARVRRLQHTLETRRHWLALSVLMGATALAISLTRDLSVANRAKLRPRQSGRQ